MVYDGPGMMTPEVWKARQALTGLPDEGACSMGYYRHTDALPADQAPPNAIAAAITFLLGRLAYDNVPVRALSQYFHAAGMSGSSTAVARHRESALRARGPRRSRGRSPRTRPRVPRQQPHGSTELGASS